MFDACPPCALLFALLAAVHPLSGHHDSHHGREGCDHFTQEHGCPTCISRGIRLEGTVSEVIYLSGSVSGDSMVEIRVATASGGEMIARLAPSSFLRSLGLDVQEDLKVIVSGFRANVRDEERLMVTHLTAEGKTWTLRDSSGRSRW